MSTVTISIDSSTHSALKALMRPALDDENDVIVSLIRNLKRRQNEAAPAQILNTAAVPTHIHTLPAKSPMPAAPIDLPVEIQAETEPKVALDEEKESSHPTTVCDIVSPVQKVGAGDDHSILGPNEIAYDDIVAGLSQFHSGMKIVISDTNATESVMSKTMPRTIRFRLPNEDGSYRWETYELSTWKHAAIMLAEKSLTVTVRDQVIYFGEMQGMFDFGGMGDAKMIGKNVNVSRSGLRVVFTPETKGLDVNGMKSFMLFRSIVAIIQNDPVFRDAFTVIEFEWKNSRKSKFCKETGIFYLTASGV